MNDGRYGLWRCGPWRRVIVGPILVILSTVIAWQAILADHWPAATAAPFLALYALAAFVTGIREIRTGRVGGG